MEIIIALLIMIFFISLGISYLKDLISPPKPPLKPIHKQTVPPPPIQPGPIISPYEEHFNNWKEQTIKEFGDSMSLSDLLIEKQITEIVYFDLLSCFEWKFKRVRILFRDSYECKDCHVRDERNHVHHLYYIKDELPWEIEDSGLITLCFHCHKKRHEFTDYKVFARQDNKLILTTSGKIYCNRCGSIGYIPKYSHVQNGICFSCWGNLINQSVFKSVLTKINDNLNDYNDDLKRNRYYEYLSQLNANDFINKVPNYKNYVNPITPEDDLPF